jgi:3-oxoacyl-[acyl-carrier protein] reductase
VPRRRRHLPRAVPRWFVSYLRIPDPGDAAVPEIYSKNRAMDAANVLAAIEMQGGRAVAIEADLAEPKTSERLFDAAESAFGPVDILINNATGWVADTFSPTPSGRFGHRQVRVSVEKSTGNSRSMLAALRC